MATVWDGVILDHTLKGDGAAILLLHAPDLEAFFNRAKGWLRTNVGQDNYSMRFIHHEQAQRILDKFEKPVDYEYVDLSNDLPVLFLQFRHSADVTLFRLAVD